MISALTHGFPASRHAAPVRHPNILVRIARALAQEIRVRRDMRLLASFDETALHDIGLTRGGAEDAVRHGRGPRDVFQPATSTIDERPFVSSFDTEWR